MLFRSSLSSTLPAPVEAKIHDPVCVWQNESDMRLLCLEEGFLKEGSNHDFYFNRGLNFSSWSHRNLYCLPCSVFCLSLSIPILFVLFAIFLCLAVIEELSGIEPLSLEFEPDLQWISDHCTCYREYAAPIKVSPAVVPALYCTQSVNDLVVLFADGTCVDAVAAFLKTKKPIGRQIRPVLFFGFGCDFVDLHHLLRLLDVAIMDETHEVLVSHCFLRTTPKDKIPYLKELIKFPSFGEPNNFRRISAIDTGNFRSCFEIAMHSMKLLEKQNLRVAVFGQSSFVSKVLYFSKSYARELRSRVTLETFVYTSR